MSNVRLSYLFTAALGLSGLLGATTTVSAQTLPPQERLCDPTYEDCREDILQYIRQETVEIDMGFWMMTDARYANELVRAWGRGVKIRLLMDPRCGAAHSACNSPTICRELESQKSWPSFFSCQAIPCASTSARKSAGVKRARADLQKCGLPVVT